MGKRRGGGGGGGGGGRDGERETGRESDASRAASGRRSVGPRVLTSRHSRRGASHAAPTASLSRGGPRCCTETGEAQHPPHTPKPNPKGASPLPSPPFGAASDRGAQPPAPLVARRRTPLDRPRRRRRSVLRLVRRGRQPTRSQRATALSQLSSPRGCERPPPSWPSQRAPPSSGVAVRWRRR